MKRPWFWERLRAGEGDNRGWDGWMASPTQCTWVCVDSGSWWWTGRPGVLQFMGLQRVGHNWATELNWTEFFRFLCNIVLTASNFAFTTRHIHSWVLFPLWLSLFFPSGAISLVFSSSILDTYWSGGFIFHCYVFLLLLTILVAQRVKRLLAMRENWVWSLGREDPLEKEMATHSSTLAWKIPWTEKPGRLQSMGSQRVRHDWTTSLYLYYSGYTYWFWFSQKKWWLFWRHVASNKSRIKKDSIGIIYMEVIFEAQKRRSKRKFRRTCIIAAWERVTPSERIENQSPRENYHIFWDHSHQMMKEDRKQRVDYQVSNCVLVLWWPRKKEMI